MRKKLKQAKNDTIQILNFAKDYLKRNEILDSELEAKYIVSFVLGLSFPNLFLKKDFKVSAGQHKKISRMLKKRTKGVPLQYIFKQQEFYGIKFFVDKRVLIPRIETELLVEMALELAQEFESPKILDLCTGSGCIAVAVKKNMHNANVYASDKSKKALRVAKKNALANDVDIEFYQSDLLEDINNTFDIIVSNPPYINKEDYYMLDKKVLDFEPKIALFGGDDGMDFIEEIIVNAKDKLNEKGYMLFEIGYDQKAVTCSRLEKQGYCDIKSFSDYSGFDRIIVGRK